MFSQGFKKWILPTKWKISLRVEGRCKNLTHTDRGGPQKSDICWRRRGGAKWPKKCWCHKWTAHKTFVLQQLFLVICWSTTETLKRNCWCVWRFELPKCHGFLSVLVDYSLMYIVVISICRPLTFVTLKKETACNNFSDCFIL